MIRIIKKFAKILDANQKKKVGIIVGLMIVGAVLETLSVSLVVPLMTALMQEDFLETNEVAAIVCKITGITNARSFLLLVIGCLMLLFIIKDAFLFFEYYVQIKFICNNRMATQKRLMEVYLRRPYEFFLNASSGEIMRVIKSDTSGTYSLLTTIMNFFTEAIVAIALIIAIIVVDPEMAVMVAILLGIVMLLIYKGIKPVLRKAGADYQYYNAVANTWILQSIAGIKEMKVAHKEKFFIQEYSDAAKNAVEKERISSVLANAPRLIIESIVISGMLGYIGIMVFNGREISTLLPQLSAFALAAVRLLPSANRMSTALNSMAYLEVQLDKTIENLRSVNEFDAEYKQEGNNRIEEKITLEREFGLKNITFSYPNSEKKILEDTGLTIYVGSSVGIVGYSGAGKTTVVDILLGLLNPQAGIVESDGVDIQAGYSSWLEHLAYIPQMIYMLDDTIRANVAFGFGKDDIDDEQVWRALEEAQLGEFVRSLPEGLDTSIGERGVRLSGGQRQRIGIARALYTDPELLIFDEATSALDNETESAIMESINSLHGRKTIIIIAHRLTTIQECDVVYRVEDGKIVREK